MELFLTKNVRVVPLHQVPLALFIGVWFESWLIGRVCFVHFHYIWLNANLKNYFIFQNVSTWGLNSDECYIIKFYDAIIGENFMEKSLC